MCSLTFLGKDIYLHDDAVFEEQVYVTGLHFKCDLYHSRGYDFAPCHTVEFPRNSFTLGKKIMSFSYIVR